METQNNFAIGSIPKHIMSIAGPMIVAQLINVLYNVLIVFILDVFLM